MEGGEEGGALFMGDPPACEWPAVQSWTIHGGILVKSRNNVANCDLQFIFNFLFFMIYFIVSKYYRNSFS